jgi:hypothetical protein
MNAGNEKYAFNSQRFISSCMELVATNLGSSDCGAGAVFNGLITNFISNSPPRMPAEDTRAHPARLARDLPGPRRCSVPVTRPRAVAGGN